MEKFTEKCMIESGGLKDLRAESYKRNVWENIKNNVFAEDWPRRKQFTKKLFFNQNPQNL